LSAGDALVAFIRSFKKDGQLKLCLRSDSRIFLSWAGDNHNFWLSVGEATVEAAPDLAWDGGGKSGRRETPVHPKRAVVQEDTL
jgi:hypothetical protein